MFVKLINIVVEKLFIKLIGDIVNGLFVDYMFLIEKFKGKNECKNWFDVLIFFFYNNMIIYISSRDVNKV